MCSSPWSPLVPASKSLFDQERCSSHRGDTQGAAQQAQQPRGRGQVPLPEAPEEWSGWDILGERGDGDSTGCPLTLRWQMSPKRLGRSQIFPGGAGRRVMAVRCVFCHPGQPQDSEDGVTCGWNKALFGFKPWPGTGQS